MTELKKDQDNRPIPIIDNHKLFKPILLIDHLLYVTHVKNQDILVEDVQRKMKLTPRM